MPLTLWLITETLVCLAIIVVCVDLNAACQESEPANPACNWSSSTGP